MKWGRPYLFILSKQLFLMQNCVGSSKNWSTRLKMFSRLENGIIFIFLWSNPLYAKNTNFKSCSKAKFNATTRKNSKKWPIKWYGMLCFDENYLRYFKLKLCIFADSALFTEFRSFISFIHTIPFSWPFFRVLSSGGIQFCFWATLKIGIFSI